MAWFKNFLRRFSLMREATVPVASPGKRRWRLLQVESSIDCNLQCVMCPWKKIRSEAENRGLLSIEVWKAIHPYLPEIQSVDFTGGGEPLLQPRLVEWIREAKAAGCETGVLTNGLLLDRDKAKEMIDAGVGWIGISMDGATLETYEKIRIGSDFAKVCQNLSNIGTLRIGNVPKTMINCVLMPMNVHQISDMVRLAARLGVDQVNFKQCDVIRFEDGKDYGLFVAHENGEIRRLGKTLKKASRLARKLKVQITAFPFIPEERPVCAQDPRDSIFVRYDGAVAPCINLANGGPTTFLGKDVVMPTVHYGGLPDKDLMELWQTETCKFYRERFQMRAQAYNNRLLDTLFKTSRSSHAKTLQSARKAMPEAPEGCQVCHYLYDV